MSFSFPLNIKILEVSLQNNDFSFHAPQVNLSLNWGLFFGKEKSIAATIPKAVISSHSNNFIQSIKDFQFHVVPDFEIDIKSLSVPSDTYTLDAFPLFLQKKDKKISFRINHPELSMNGDIISEKEIQAEYKVFNKNYPLQGQLIFSLNDDTLKGTIESEMDFSFSALFIQKEDGVELQDFSIQNITDEKNSIKFFGNSRLFLKDQPKIQINGQIKSGIIENAYDLNLDLQLEDASEIVGSLNLKTGEPKIDIT